MRQYVRQSQTAVAGSVRRESAKAPNGNRWRLAALAGDDLRCGIRGAGTCTGLPQRSHGENLAATILAIPLRFTGRRSLVLTLRSESWRSLREVRPTGPSQNLHAASRGRYGRRVCTVGEREPPTRGAGRAARVAGGPPPERANARPFPLSPCNTRPASVQKFRREELSGRGIPQTGDGLRDRRCDCVLGHERATSCCKGGSARRGGGKLKGGGPPSTSPRSACPESNGGSGNGDCRSFLALRPAAVRGARMLESTGPPVDGLP